MNAGLTREKAIFLLRQYNKETFHLSHALTVEAVMRYFALKLGYSQDVDFWGLVGLLHDVDYECFPHEHCKKSVELMRNAGCSDEIIHAVCSHGYGICCNIIPEHEMEKVLFATDELTGLIGAAAKMRPSRSCNDMKISSLKKKFKDKTFASGCSRDIIRQGAQMLGWDLDELLSCTLQAMSSCEENIAKQLENMS